ncbi:MAG: hypothetical protein M3Q55_07865 [Acidobacteriota bacterium]|nr:hypothetical protein [Acidobacteriota bacterium]
MTNISEKLSAAWAWLRKWGGALALGLLGILGAGWAIRARREQLGQVKDALAVERAQREIAELKGRRDQLLATVNTDHVLVATIDAQLDANKRKLVEAHEDHEDLSDAEVADAFQKLGYIIPVCFWIGQ